MAILLGACSSKFTYQKRRYQKGHFFVKHHKHLPPKQQNDEPHHFNSTAAQTETALADTIRFSEFIKKESSITEQKNAEPPYYAEKQTYIKNQDVSISKKFCIKALPDNFQVHAKQFLLTKHANAGDGWKNLLKVLAVIALILLIIGILYIGLIMILIGGVLTGGVIFSEPRFILFLILLGLLVIGCVLLSLYIINA